MTTCVLGSIVKALTFRANQVARSGRGVEGSDRGALEIVGRRDEPGHRARRNYQRTGKVDLARPASAGEVAVLGAHGHLLGPVARSGAGLDAGAAGGVDELGAGLAEHLEIPLL